MVKEKFIPVQINQEMCMHCERCLKACRAKAIYFEHSVRLVDYNKCRGCLNCVAVCPRNAIEVTSVVPDQIVSIKIDHELCNMCGLCIDPDGAFCPKHLYYKGTIKKGNIEEDGIKFKFNEISSCQGCLLCENSCPQEAIKTVKYKG